MPAVLYIEDNPDEAELMRHAVFRAQARFRLNIRSTYQEALDYLQNGEPDQPSAEHPEPDLVLLDYSLGTFSGTQLLTFIRANPELQTLPVVMLSGSTDDHIVAKCYALGANYFIAKPMDCQRRLELVQSIDACLQVNPLPIENLAELAVSPHLTRQSLKHQLRQNRVLHAVEVKKQNKLRMAIDLLLAEAKELRRRFPFNRKDSGEP